jgi:translation initiation factor eIF-2B subunit delta
MDNPPEPPAGVLPLTDSATAPPPSADTNSTPTASVPAAKAEEKKLSGAELKKKQKAEKAARRAKEKAETGGSKAPPPPAQKTQKKDQQQAPKGGPSKAGVNPTPTAAKQQTAMPSRTRRPSTAAPAVKAPPVKQVSLFGHLYGHPRRYVIEGATKEVHPAILALGLQMSSYEVCGSTARCVAMLLAFKSVRFSQSLNMSY